MMNKKMVAKKKTTEIEGLLEAYLNPVNPRPEFISQLRRRLLDTSRPVVNLPGKKYVDYGLVALVSLAGSALVLITGIRAVLTVMSALGILHLVKSQTENQRVSSPETAG